MGLWDWFRRSPDKPPQTREDWLRIGKLEADVESIRLQWATYKDELSRLVQRLEKRDQRAAQREMAQQPTPEPVSRYQDDISERVKARRERRNGLRGPGSKG